jgi:hypothetical protein
VSADPTVAVAARVARLLLWYPRAWRNRYGEEFTELLISDIEERPRSARRALDVAHGGIMARLTDVGLAGCPLPPLGGGVVTAQVRYRQVSASLGSLGGVLAVFLTVAAALWSELVIYQQSLPRSVGRHPQGPPAPPEPAPTALIATDVISVAMLVLLALAVLAALPVLATLVTRSLTAGSVAVRSPAANRAGRGARSKPFAVLVAGVTFLVVGGRHFENGWPGTGGHGSFVPAGLAAFEWATSLSVSAYWAHPASFIARFPRAEVGWMAVSPLALALTVIAAAILIRRAGLSPRVLAFEVRVGAVACGVMLVVFGAAALWVATSGGSRPTGGGILPPFHAGLIDLAGTGLLALALPVAAQASRQARRELRLAQRELRLARSAA